MKLKRPLVKRVSADPGWVIQVYTVSHGEYFVWPVFRWAFCSGEVCEGEMLVLCFLGELMFCDMQRPSANWSFASVDPALEKIDIHGWGEPPYIDEVFQDTCDFYNKLPLETLEDLRNALVFLQQKWETLVAQYYAEEGGALQQTRKNPTNDFWEKELSGIEFNLGP